MIYDELLARVARLLDAIGVPYAVIGGQAVLVHGEERFTRDVDATIQGDHDLIPDLVRRAGEYGLEPAVEDLLMFARKTCMIVMKDQHSAAHVDLAFGFTPFETLLIARAKSVEVQGVPVRVASAEDLIIQKCFAGRPHDWSDVRSILLRQRGRLDLVYVRHWLPQLAEVADEPGIVEQFEEMVRRFYIPPERESI